MPERSKTARVWWAWVAALGVGLAWFAIEIVLQIVSDPSLSGWSFVRLALARLPWQLALFALVGAMVFPVVHYRARDSADAVWWVLGAASFLFLGVRVAEGALRRSTALHAILAVVAVAVMLGVGLAALRTLGRLLPARVARAWPFAVWCGWSLFFLSFLRRAAPALGNDAVGFTDWIRFVEPGEVALGAGLAGLLLIAGSGLRRGPAALLALALTVGATGAAGAPGAAGATQPDVVVVLIDTFRFDHLGENVGRTGLTPNLDRFAQEAIRFERAFSPANVTRLAMPGVMTSLPATVTGRSLPDEVDTLAEVLKEAGYRTLGISTNPNVSGELGYEQGFDVFLDPTRQPDFLVAGMLQLLGGLAPGFAYNTGIVNAGLYYTPLSEVRRRAAWLLERSRGPVFLYLQTMDPHGPYLPPRSYLPDGFEPRDFYSYYAFNRLGRREVINTAPFAPHLRNIKQRYEAEVRYTDAEFGELMAMLRAQGRFEESLIWVLSDHGEAFGEHDFSGHGGPNLHDMLIRIPLLLKLPRSWGVPARVEAVPVSTFDLLPTTVSLLGLTPPADLFGHDLGRAVREGSPESDRTIASFNRQSGEDWAFETYAAISWPWKLISRYERDVEAPVLSRLFDLEADPREEEDVADRNPETVIRLERELAVWRARERERRVGTASGDLDPAVRERLRRLGYVE